MKTTTIRTDEQTSRNLRDLAASRMRDLVNGYSAVNALFALTESELYRDLEASEERVLHAASAASAHGYDVYQVTGLLRYLATQGIFVEEADGRFRLSPLGQAVFSPGSLGWLRMVRGGYGDIMHQAGDLIAGRKRYGHDLVRYGRYVGMGSSQYTSAVRDNVGHRALEQLGSRCVVDIGCGAAHFSIQFVKRDPAHRAIAVDVDDGSIGAAREAIAAAGLTDRIKIVQADALQPSELVKHCGEADTFFTFAMEHELLRDGDEAVLRHVESMSQHFPGRRFLIGEAVNKLTAENGVLYWFHLLSMQGIPRDIPFWTDSFARLSRGRLEEVFVPDYGPQVAYYSILL